MALPSIIDRSIAFVGGVVLMTFGWTVVFVTGAMICCSIAIELEFLLWLMAAILPLAAIISWKLFIRPKGAQTYADRYGL